MTDARLIKLAHRGRTLRIEHRWIGGAAAAPLVVFLHEGLGSVSMWRDFPDRLCAALGVRGLVYSRTGYGGSTPRAAGERWSPTFMHEQAHELLPALLAALGVDARARPPWLFGHSDGGSIALLYAAKYPQALAGAVVLAPHILVEDLSVESIARTKMLYTSTDLREKLARHHDDPDSAFWGWNEIWLDPGFRQWSIEAELPLIACPVLAIQGLDDEYGTLAQVHGIARQVPQAEVVELADCGHSPHRDQTAAVIAATQRFMSLHTGASR